MSNEFKISETQFNELIGKLDTLTKLIAASIFEDKPRAEGILFLSDLGLQPKEIAKILGTTPNVIRTAKSRAKSKKRAMKAKGG